MLELSKNVKMSLKELTAYCPHVHSSPSPIYNLPQYSTEESMDTSRWCWWQVPHSGRGNYGCYARLLKFEGGEERSITRSDGEWKWFLAIMGRQNTITHYHCYSDAGWKEPSQNLLRPHTAVQVQCKYIITSICCKNLPFPFFTFSFPLHLEWKSEESQVSVFMSS